jgi:hypothetical protein
LELYSFVECIGKGKTSAPYEFGVKVSIVTANARAPGGHFALNAKALPGNPYDGHTLAVVIEATERLTPCAIERDYVDKGYRGHDTRTRGASSSHTSWTNVLLYPLKEVCCVLATHGRLRLAALARRSCRMDDLANRPTGSQNAISAPV